jgi:hypothetical protein
LSVLWNQNLSSRQRRSAGCKRSNGCKVIREFRSQSEKKRAKGEVTNLQTVRSPHSPALRLELASLPSERQGDDRDLAWLVELLESVLASSIWASLKTPARSLLWKERLGQALSTMAGKI